MSQTMFQATSPALTLPRWISQATPLNAVFSHRGAVLAGVVTGVTLDAAGMLLHGGTVFAALLAAELALAVARVSAPRDAGRLAIVALWCGLQGVALAAATLSREPGLQLLAAVLVMGQLGVICAKGSTTPRLTFLLAALCDLPFLAAAAWTQEAAPLVLLLQAPLWCMGLAAWLRAGPARAGMGHAVGLEIA